MNTLIEPQSDHLKVVLEGRSQMGQLADNLKNIFAISAEKDLHKILVDIIHIEGNLSMMTRFEAGHMAALLKTHHVKLAVLAREDQLLPDRFFENVANNRGLLTKVTTNLDEALAWLRAEDK